jgi:hypothetical protein
LVENDLPAANDITRQFASHTERHRALVDRLATNLRPVRPLWTVGRRLALWLAIELAILGYTLLQTTNDYVPKLESPGYALQVAFFATAGVILAAMALRSAVPGREASRAEIIAAVALAVAGAVMLLFLPMRVTGSLREFVMTGSFCSYETCIKALIPWIALWWAVKRGAPTNGRAVGAMVGGAATLFTFAVMRLDCPIDEGLHLIVWHLGPVVLIIALSAIAGAAWLRLRAPRLPLSN